MSNVSSTTPDSQTRPRIVIAGAGPAAQALVRQLARTPFAGGITMLSNRDDAPAGLLELAALPQVSLRFGQPVSYIDPDGRRVTTADGLEFTYDQLVIATGSSPAGAPLAGAGRCLSYSTIDDANGLGEAVKDVTRVLGRRPLGILVGTGTAAGQAEAVLRARGVRPVRTTLRPAAVLPNLAGSMLPAAGVVFEDGSSMNGDLVVLAEERIARDALSVSAGLKTAPRGGIVIGEDFRTSVPGIWAIGDAAVFDGVRLGLLVAAGSAASVCAAQLLRATLAEPLADAA
ncbi:3-phenylpropionate/trans-cinnamate dioxygenase ferredoxin reductase subunit [Arthrobacter sp. V4I6]|uniref:FAD-dependent oxidoreductase n=1 Tax=unclassified Arthrobacter TaxID=235627 RepID=UPI00277F419D|nr:MULTISPECIES: FAD-dependent oxidoreductase [unclassified Arthrobacter]MDQ0822092.1 3-phenylpropionate/trans-cinnamate dioxygenase ferredoxin reductase subunit [Arthrobacter sp. V1I7]MDQ0856360.1 3-phenylpropionate/trans-cinnamate dioxygenase ferredoxin reductase subunit [Arthrobacter sp. V4I6]